MATLEEHFWSRVDCRGAAECWDWKGAVRRDWYAQFRHAGRWYQAHRLALVLTVGPIGELHALHSCDNPRCCNPAHLRAGTRKENMQDALRRGRFHCGGTRPFVLTPDVVANIRAALASGTPKTRIAREHNVSPKTVRDIAQGRTWGAGNRAHRRTRQQVASPCASGWARCG